MLYDLKVDCKKVVKFYKCITKYSYWLILGLERTFHKNNENKNNEKNWQSI